MTFFVIVCGSSWIRIIRSTVFGVTVFAGTAFQELMWVVMANRMGWLYNPMTMPETVFQAWYKVAKVAKNDEQPGC